MSSERPEKIVVLGMMTKMPVAGVVWQTVHYLVGLERLGFDVYYVEAHARTPSMLMEREDDDASARAAAFIDRVLRQFDLSGRWAFHALHDDGRCYGISWRQLQRLYRSAAVIINLHGGTQPLPEHYETGRLVYLETDPVQLQVELHDNVAETIDFLEPHSAFFTFGQNYGNPDCLLPVSERFTFYATRQPVVLDFWAGHDGRNGDSFTTIGNWQQHWRSITYLGETYSWSKHDQFLKFLDLPRRSGRRFELALSSYEEADRALLEEHGWAVRPALAISTDLAPYRDYICSSKAEFTVAKDQNVRLRSGWFSDRSATYLAAGRPVITQDTGFENILPTGEGLFAVKNVEEAAAAVQKVQAEYERNSSAASDVARSYFASDLVLEALLREAGLSVTKGPLRPRKAPPLPSDVPLIPLSRRPIVLPDETAQAVLQRSVPWHDSVQSASSPPRTSVVVLSFDNLVFTRMCLESLLSDSHDPFDEVLVVDNGSADGSAEYISALAQRAPIVRPVLNEENLGFASGVNQGLRSASGERLVVLNNDTIVPPQAIRHLVGHLDDLSIGVIGPVTNASGNGARLMTSYRTYGEMLGFAKKRWASHRGRQRDLDVLHMFCFALRRDVMDQVGLLDERFEVGLFEDDDFCRRVRNRGLRVVCADDVFVHHFGEASLGKLVGSGAYGQIFDANRRRYEEKWGVRWESPSDGADPSYATLVQRVRNTVARCLPKDAGVAVVSRGDAELLRLGTRRAWHFPQGDDEGFAGYYPADSDEAIRNLDALRQQGATHLVFPATALWWLQHYVGLRNHLEDLARSPLHADECCVIYLLSEKS